MFAVLLPQSVVCCFVFCGCIESLLKSEYLDVGSGKYLLAAHQTVIILYSKILVYGVMGCCVCFWCGFDCEILDCLL